MMFDDAKFTIQKEMIDMYTTPSTHDPITCSAATASLYNVVSTSYRTITASILHHNIMAIGNNR